MLKPTEPLPLNHSWPLFERGQHFDLGLLHDMSALRAAAAALVNPIEVMPVTGRWECDLSDNKLTWSAEVFDLFGLPLGAPVTRDEVVALYCEESRAAMERLRTYAIRHQRGFTMDVEIRSVTGVKRWMRLTAAPICENDRVVRLHGLKQDVSDEYG